VRKEYDLHHPKPDLDSLDGMATTINTCFVLKYFLFTKETTTILYDAQPTCAARE
jgi:hypothetical protein